MSAPPEPLLFVCGALQSAEVQRDIFGHLPLGTPDALTGFVLDYAPVQRRPSPEVSGLSVRPALRATGDDGDRVPGAVLQLSLDDLRAADRTRPPEQRRVSARLASGRAAWVYVP